MRARAEERAKKDAEKLLKKLSTPKKIYSPPKKVSAKKAKQDRELPNHKEIYWAYFGYQGGDFIPCEVCGAESVDVHHIDSRGMGGDPQRRKDVIENLQALCRECHIKYGDKESFMGMLITIHNNTLRPKETI